MKTRTVKLDNYTRWDTLTPAEQAAVLADPHKRVAYVTWNHYIYLRK